MSDPAARACDVCSVVDTLPRHIVNCAPDTPGAVPSTLVIRQAIANGADDAAIDALLDPTTLIRHFACCAENGCDICATAVTTNA